MPPPPIPRPPIPATVADALVQPGSPWRAVEVLDASASTNAALAARARAGEPPGLVLVAEHQTAGRGRLDRVWVTPPRAALTFSVLLVPDEVPVRHWPWLPLLSGLAVAAGVRRAAGVACSVKWPNDVLVSDRKLAGILVERVERERGAAAVVGIGVNVSSTRDELPVTTATSLVLEGADTPDRAWLLVAVLDELAGRYGRWVASGGAGDDLRTEYLDACSTIGRPVRVDLPDGSTVTGDATGVDADGRLLVRTAAGPRALGAGDVVHARSVT